MFSSPDFLLFTDLANMKEVNILVGWLNFLKIYVIMQVKAHDTTNTYRQIHNFRLQSSLIHMIISHDCLSVSTVCSYT